MIPRKMADEDLEECIGVNAAGIGQEIVGRQRALSAWRVLVKNPRFTGVVLESPEPIAGHRTVAFAAAVFVSKEFSDCEIFAPKPGLNARIIASIDTGRSVVLTEAELQYGNTYDGLFQAILYSTWKRGILTSEQTAQVEMDFAKIYFQIFAGYRLERLLFEATDSLDIEHAKATKVWNIISDFADFHAGNAGNSWNRDRALAVIERTGALSVLGSASALFFDYHKPILRFTRGDRELLEAAIEGLTDDELACALHLKKQTVKKRWASVFDQAASVMPGLLPESDGTINRPTRGPQKRHHLLAYVRRHPEELRPFIH